MSELKENSFFCPYCGEQILKNAKICRFCKHSVAVNLYIQSVPADANLGEIARTFFEKGPKLFPTFGALRKRLETPGAFVTDVKPDDAEKVIQILGKSGIVIEQRDRLSANPSSPAIPLNSILLFFGIIGVGAFLFFFLYKPEKPDLSLTPSITQSVTSSDTSTSPNQISSSTEQVPLTKQSHANIESLLISTATIFVDGGSGSGFFVSRDGHLISNQHVTKSAKEVDVQTYDGKRYRGKVLRSQDFYDLSLIKIESTNYPPLRLGDATKLHPGDTVWTIGAPHGLEFSVTKGIASFVGRNVGGKAFVQADVAINPGNSGGPMINDEGEVIGINNFIIKQTVGLNFAIPANYLYMGSSPILEGVIPTTSDSGTMVTWRSWEREASPTGMKASESTPELHSAPAPSSSSELLNLDKQLKATEQKFTNTQTKQQSVLNSLNQQISSMNSQYTNAQTVSDQEKVGQTLRKLQMQKIDVEIEMIDDFLEYNKMATQLMTRAKQLSDASMASHYNSELSKLAKSKSESESSKSAKQAQRTEISMQQF